MTEEQANKLKSGDLVYIIGGLGWFLDIGIKQYEFLRTRKSEGGWFKAKTKTIVCREILEKDRYLEEFEVIASYIHKTKEQAIKAAEKKIDYYIHTKDKWMRSWASKEKERIENFRKYGSVREAITGLEIRKKVENQRISRNKKRVEKYKLRKIKETQNA